jgi:hypothetical protein
MVAVRVGWYDFISTQPISEDAMKNRNFGPICFLAWVLAIAGCSKPAANMSSDATGSTPDATGSSSAPAPSGSPMAGANSSATRPEAAPSAPPVVVRAGVAMDVTVDQAVSSKDSNAGDHFEASFAAPVNVNGRQVIPAGAKATGTVVDAKSAGKFKGNAELTVTLSSVRIHGRDYRIQTSSFTDAGKGRGKRTAIGAGGGAALGALIGGLAGHGKGAAIGAVAGGGAGTAGAAFTGDRDVTIAAETRVTFKLKEPLEIR